MGFSQDVLQLILFRFVQGVGGAMIQSSGRTLAFRAMPAGSEGKAQGLMAMSHQLGFFIGPPIGGLIIDLVHWRGIFFLLFVPSLVGLMLCFRNWTTSFGLRFATSADRLPRRTDLSWSDGDDYTASRSENSPSSLGGISQALLAVTFVGGALGFRCV